MRRIPLTVWVVGLLWAVGVVGCAVLPQPTGLELKPPKMANDSIVLEVFLVRLPPEEELNSSALWTEIDEMSLSADLRQRLAERGFRAGVTVGRIPVELERLMELAESSNTKSNDTAVVDFEKDSKVSRRILQMRAGRRGEILASPIHSNLSVFEKQAGGVQGQSYRQAQCCFAVSGIPQPDGRVKLQVESEVQHGDARVQHTVEDNSWVSQVGRDRVKLDAIKIETPLEPGQILVLGGPNASDGSLGDYFFTEEVTGGKARRLVLVRLAQVQQDGLFSNPDDAK